MSKKNQNVSNKSLSQKLASSRGLTSLVKILLKKKADINTVNQFGQSALHLGLF